MKRIVILIGIVSIAGRALAQQPSITWPADKVNAWYKQQEWLAGANFLPSNAINQLEMWQAETYDTATISRELSYAENIGFNTMRVFLHDLVWKEDAAGFKERIHVFLNIAARHHIKPFFVFFDDCWNPDPKPGKQPEPIPGVHNSGWMHSPSQTVHNDSTQWGYLENYVKDIITTFKNDDRVLMWDLYNEPGHTGYGLTSMPLLKKITSWAREAAPSQPITIGVWNVDFRELNSFQLLNSDVITFHDYDDTVALKIGIEALQQFGRPVICTEYMARTKNSYFLTHLPIMKRYNVGAVNWGLVSGKSNTIYEWDKPMPDGAEPAIWFHDIFRKDGTPYSREEIALIEQLTGKSKKVSYNTR